MFKVVHLGSQPGFESFPVQVGQMSSTSLQTLSLFTRRHCARNGRASLTTGVGRSCYLRKMAALLKSSRSELREENRSRGAMVNVNAAMKWGGEPTIDCLGSLQGSQEESCMVQQRRTCFTTNLALAAN